MNYENPTTPALIPLKSDALIYKRNDGQAPADTHRERRIITVMIAHLDNAGFKLEAVNNGEETIPVANILEALEEIYSVGDSKVYFRSPAGKRHWVLLITGNGIDVIGDYGSPVVSDGFAEALDLPAFDPEQIA